MLMMFESKWPSFYSNHYDTRHCPYCICGFGTPVVEVWEFAPDSNIWWPYKSTTLLVLIFLCSLTPYLVPKHSDDMPCCILRTNITFEQTIRKPRHLLNIIVKIICQFKFYIEFSTWGSSMQHHDIPDTLTHGNVIKITGYIRRWKIQTIEKYGRQSQVNIIFWGNVSFK